MFKKFIFGILGLAQVYSSGPLVTAEKLIQHQRLVGRYGDFEAPEVVLVCYQRSTLEYLLEKHPEFKHSNAVTHLYQCGKVGILGDWGVGAPGLSIKLECLIEHGTKRFVAVGTAGGLLDMHKVGDCVLCPSALAEDGVAHLYLDKGEKIAYADHEWIETWKTQGVDLCEVRAWSFSALFRETLKDVHRVSRLGCSVVEMDAATLYAIAKEKGAKAFSLFVISDTLGEEWQPHMRTPLVSENLHRLADGLLDFCSAFLLSNEVACDNHQTADDKHCDSTAV